MNTDDHKQKLAELERISDEQDAKYEASLADHEAKVAELTGAGPILDETDVDRAELLDRLADRIPEMDLDQHEVEWTRVPDGAEALVVDGGGFDGGTGVYFANAGEDVHAVGSMAPAFPVVGCIVIRPDRTRVLAQVMPDPLAEELDASDGRSAD